MVIKFLKEGDAIASKGLWLLDGFRNCESIELDGSKKKCRKEAAAAYDFRWQYWLTPTEIALSRLI
jgi:hypothetical protein